MQRFKSIPAKISVDELEHHESDKFRLEANQSRKALPPKHFVKHNQKMVRTIQGDFTKSTHEKQALQDQAKLNKSKGRGELPNYLKKFK